ncbi:MAG TPA: NPCBM/NEW2 domain-containing protein [Pirellulales bacterium]|nr:NPCBM/NEW2 domain-containing protein [Pirellulales bacterium]
MLCSAALLCTALTTCAVSAAEPEGGLLIDIAHAGVEARLAGVAADGLFTFQVGTQARRVPADELVAWGAPVEPRDSPQVILTDGSLLVVRDVLKTDEGRVLLDSDAFGEFALPRSAIAAILLHPPIDPQRRDRLAGRFTPSPRQEGEPASPARPSPSSDRLLLENGDELVGRITAVTDSGVEFAADIGPLTVDRQRIIALAFSLPPFAVRKDDVARSERRPSPRLLLVGLRDGSVFHASALTMDQDQMRAELFDRVKVVAPAQAVVFAQTLGGRATYLSNLEPESYRHLPYLSLAWPYRLDANVTGTRLRAGGRIYAKGIGIHSTARLTFRLEKPYRRFEADLAIDDQTQRRGSVVFRVLAGPREIYKSGVVRGGDPPLPISVNVSGVNQLSLVVDYADRADELDHADWLNARLIE